MNSNKLLPVGSVVLLKEADKMLTIIGILPINDGQKHDYLAVPHPEGYINDKYVFVFDQQDIAEVKYIGYMDSAYQMFRSGLAAALEKQEAET